MSKTMKEGTLKKVGHADGTCTRLHVAKILRAAKNGRRVRQWTWIVGYGVDAEGCAKGGADCHKTLDAALAAFAAEVARKGGTTHTYVYFDGTQGRAA